MIYLCAGLFAEGPTDYRFLMPLLDRLLWEVAQRALSQGIEVAETVAIDAPAGSPSGRGHAIPAAIDAYWDQCTLFVIHSDGAGDPAAALAACVMPGIDVTRLQHPDLVAVACVPVREIEAWMLTDAQVFRGLVKGNAELQLPRDPESELDPKRALRQIFTSLGARLDKLEDPYAYFGANVRIDTLRALPAFQRFEAELASAVKRLARLAT